MRNAYIPYYIWQYTVSVQCSCSTEWLDVSTHQHNIISPNMCLTNGIWIQHTTSHVYTLKIHHVINTMKRAVQDVFVIHELIRLQYWQCFTNNHMCMGSNVLGCIYQPWLSHQTKCLLWGGVWVLVILQDNVQPCTTVSVHHTQWCKCRFVVLLLCPFLSLC